ncbi:MAG TPA: aquaporin [Micromonosporaceae bacterium]|jgi:MIP family channel proteins|nr:aquaporin [Micromonosporaceae bacterium]
MSAITSRLSAEALGTLVLVYFGCAAIVSGAGLLGFSIAFALALAAAIWVFGATSGGHFNPWVTLATALRGQLSWVEAAEYAIAQLIGATVASLLLWATYGTAGINGLLGATRLGAAADSGVGLLSGLVAEALGTFVFICVIISLTTGARAGNRTTGLGIGLTLGLANISLAMITGASLNFARTFAPEFVLTIRGGGVADWSHIWVYLLGPAIGAAAAAFAYDRVTMAPAAKP